MESLRLRGRAAKDAGRLKSENAMRVSVNEHVASGKRAEASKREVAEHP